MRGQGALAPAHHRVTTRFFTWFNFFNFFQEFDLLRRRSSFILAHGGIFIDMRQVKFLKEQIFDKRKNSRRDNAKKLKQNNRPGRGKIDLRRGRRTMFVGGKRAEKGQTTLKKEKRVGTGFFLSLFHFFLSWVDHVVSSGTQFLSFFLLVAVFLSLGFRRPNILTGLSGWQTPD